MSVPRSLAVGVAALVSVGAAAGGAVAQVQENPVEVSASTDVTSRQFFVRDLAGVDLTDIALDRSGKGELFQVGVEDDGFASPQATFTANAEMSHLYLTDDAGAPVYGTRVTSDKVRISYLGAPDVAGVALGATPVLSLTGALPTCADLPDLLPVGSALLLDGGPLQVLDPLLSPLDQLLGSLGLSEAAGPLCTALGGSSTTPLPVAQADAVLVDLQQQLIEPALDGAAGLPVDLAGSGDSGSFTHPSYLGEVPSADTTKPASPAAATRRLVLAGRGNSAFDLDGLISPLLDGKDLFGAEGLTTVTSVVEALQESATSSVAAVGTQLAGLAETDQTGILSGLTGVAEPLTATLSSTVLDKISGTYRTFPRLEADLAGAPAGEYTGRMTVTFFQQ